MNQKTHEVFLVCCDQSGCVEHRVITRAVDDATHPEELAGFQRGQYYPKATPPGWTWFCPLCVKWHAEVEAQSE